VLAFSHPVFLIVALALTVLCVMAYRVVARRRAADALLYTKVDFFMEAARPRRFPQIILLCAFGIAAALLGSAVAGPHITARLPAKDAAVMLCIDTSGSMSAADVQPTRAQAAQEAARAFISRLPEGTKIGIVTFSGNAILIQPLTPDRDVALSALDRTPLPGGATAIGDALALAGQQLPRRGHRAVVLMTDGVNNRGVDPIEAADALAAQHVPVYTVGIGTNDSGLLIPGTNEPAQLDEDQLRAIAQSGAGAYAKVSDARSLQDTLAHLGASTTLETRKIDAALPFAMGGGLLLVATMLIGMAAGRFP
jgi:Ca-activated chloride channel family protein